MISTGGTPAFGGAVGARAVASRHPMLSALGELIASSASGETGEGSETGTAYRGHTFNLFTW
jgi:hypothetical protein